MLLFLDVETTGFNPENAELLELSAVRFDGKKMVAQFDELIHPESPNAHIPPVVERLTGISLEMVQTKPSLEEVRQKFLKTFLLPEDVIVGHNIAFDTGFLRAKQFSFENEEIDTYPLSTLILPDEKSHSLEILSEKYNLLHENTHRALDDCIANIQLWQLLQTVYFQKFSESLQEQYREVLEKSSWSGKLFFEALPSAQETNTAQKTDQLVLNFEKSLSPEISEKITMGTFENTGNDAFKHYTGTLFQTLEKRECTIFELHPPAFPESFLAALDALCLFAEQHGKQVEISCNAVKYKNVQHLFSVIQKEFPAIRFAFFQKPEMTICSTKWGAFLKKSAFNDLETIVALKVLRDLAQEKYSVPNLKQKEWQVWPQLSGAHHHDCSDNCAGKKNMPENFKDQYDIVFSRHEDISVCFADILFVEDAEELEEILTLHSQSIADSRHLRSLLENTVAHVSESVAFLLDFISGIVRKEAGENMYPVEIPVSKFSGYEKEWSDFVARFSEITAGQEIAGHKAVLAELNSWKSFFEETGAGTMNANSFFRIFPNNELQCITAPIDLKDAFSEMCAQHEVCLFTGNYFPRSNPSTIAFSFPFSESCYAEHLVFFPEQNCAIFTPKPALRDAHPESMLPWIQEIMKNSSENVLVHTSSQKNAEQLEEALADEFSETSQILSHRSGGIGKVQQFLKSSRRIVLIGTSSFFDRLFADIRILYPPFGIVIFQKFLFDPPGNFLLEARRDFFQNPFQEFAVPRSIARFEKEFFRLWSSQDTPPLFFCCDPRLHQNYLRSGLQTSSGNPFAVIPVEKEEMPDIFFERKKEM